MSTKVLSLAANTAEAAGGDCSPRSMDVCAALQTPGQTLTDPGAELGPQAVVSLPWPRQAQVMAKACTRGQVVLPVLRCAGGMYWYWLVASSQLLRVLQSICSNSYAPEKVDGARLPAHPSLAGMERTGGPVKLARAAGVPAGLHGTCLLQQGLEAPLAADLWSAGHILRGRAVRSHPDLHSCWHGVTREGPKKGLRYRTLISCPLQDTLCSIPVRAHSVPQIKQYIILSSLGVCVTLAAN